MVEQLTLEEVCSHLVDCVNRTAPETLGGGYFAVGTPAMRGNVINLAVARQLSADTFETWTRRLVPQEGDLLLAREAPVGPVVRIPAGGTIAAGQRTMHLRANQRVVHDRYLYYLLISPQVQSDLLGMAMGSTVSHLRVADVKAFRLPALPSVTEQRSIAEVLGVLDDKIAANDRVAKTSRELARRIYTLAVAGVDEVPMSSVLEPFLGGTPSRSDESAWDGSVPWVSAKDITGAPNGVIIDTAEGISEAASQTKRLRALPSGSVILTARGTVGVVARLAIDSAINQSCYAFEPGQIPAASLTFVIENASAQAKSMAHGSVFDTITMRTFDHVKVPSLSDEKWQRVEATIAPLLDTTSEAVVESALLARTRDELLPLLMSGKLRVDDVDETVLV